MLRVLLYITGLRKDALSPINVGEGTIAGNYDFSKKLFDSSFLPRSSLLLLAPLAPCSAQNFSHCAAFFPAIMFTVCLLSSLMFLSSVIRAT